MPTYGYECTTCNEQFEVMQRITDSPLTVHEGCGGMLRKLLYPVGIVFKGPGFYVNDYAKKGQNGAKAESASKPDAASPADSAAKTETKSETKSESTSTKSESTPAPAS